MIAPVASELEIEKHGGDAAEWDALARGDGGTACHRHGWRAIMEDGLGHECAYLAARDRDGGLRGVLPLVRVRSRLFGHYAVSMPFLNDGGPLGPEPVRAALAERAVERARAWGVDLLELRAREPVPGGLRRSDRKLTVHLPLPPTKEALWKETFRAKLRSQIRRPKKEGMEARFGAEEVLPFYEVFSRNMRDLGTPVLPRSFFERIARVFPEDAVFATVYHRGTPVAAGCGLAHGEEFEITWASSLREFNRLSPNMLLYASLMERMVERGVTLFNFGRCTPESSTHRFKRQWGGADVPLPWAQWSASGVDATPSQDGRLFQLATAAWQRLPLAAANRLGPILSRQIP